jgi:hypothetical protein
VNYGSEASPSAGFRFGRVGTAALVASGLVLPLLLLEWINREDFLQNFPLVLFVVLWVLPFAFVLLWPVAFKDGLKSWGGGTSKWVAVALLLLLGWMWFSIVIDQMPCFMGVPNCD